MKDTANVSEVCEEEGFKEKETMIDTAKAYEVCEEEATLEDAKLTDLVYFSNE